MSFSSIAKTIDRYQIVSVGCGIFVLVALAVGWVKNNEPSSNESPWISGLFIPPIAAQVICLVFLRLEKGVGNRYYYFNLLTTTLCLGGYCWMWGAYFGNSKASMRYSYICLIFILLLLTSVAIMTFAIIRPYKDGRIARLSTDLRAGIVSHPPCALLLFLTLFLGVAYLFGFALAFHDQHAISESKKERPALHMVNLNSIDDLPPSAPEQDNSSGKEVGQPSSQPSNTQPSSQADNIFYFYFKPKEASLKIEKSDMCKIYIEMKMAPPRSDKNLTKPEVFNYSSLEVIKRKIEGETNAGKRVRITLIGHADESPTDISRDPFTRYKSNYELSEARVQSVRYQILEQLPKKWHNIEWVLFSSSNEPISQIITPSSDDEKRVVIASIEPISDHIAALQMTQIQQTQYKQLKLMDYMYFAIYTITTTGYGDIIPTTGYAKFVVSIANIFEVIFLVVFFNALISLKGDGNQKDKPDKSDGRIIIAR